MITGRITGVSAAEGHSVVTISADLRNQECRPKSADLHQVQESLAAVGIKLGGPLDDYRMERVHVDAAGLFEMTIVATNGAETTFVAEKCEFAESSAGYALCKLYFPLSDDELQPFIGKEAAVHERVAAAP